MTKTIGKKLKIKNHPCDGCVVKPMCSQYCKKASNFISMDCMMDVSNIYDDYLTFMDTETNVEYHFPYELFGYYAYYNLREQFYSGGYDND